MRKVKSNEGISYRLTDALVQCGMREGQNVLADYKSKGEVFQTFTNYNEKHTTYYRYLTLKRHNLPILLNER